MNRIKELRLRKGLIQSDLARQVNVDQATISYVERDCFCYIPLANRLAEFFRVPLEYLFPEGIKPKRR